MNCVPSLPSPLAHAYLITGGSQEARRTYAEKMAAAYLCTGERPPCGRCRSCEKVGKGIHPDVTLLCPAEGKREIVADQAGPCVQTPISAPTRVCGRSIS